MQTADVIKYTFLETNDRTLMVKKYRDSYILVVIMTQYSLKAGFKKFGDSGEYDVIK